MLCMFVSACAAFAQSMFNPAMPVYGQSIGLKADVIGFITAAAVHVWTGDFREIFGHYE